MPALASIRLLGALKRPPPFYAHHLPTQPKMPNIPNLQSIADQPATSSEAHAALREYTHALERQLRPTLQTALAKRNRVFDELIELEQAQTALRALRLTRDDDNSPVVLSNDPGQTPSAMEMRVNIGEEFYMQACVPKLEPVIVDVGLGVMVEMSMDDAVWFFEERKKALEILAKSHSKHIADVQQQVDQMTHNLNSLQLHTTIADLSATSPSQP